MKSTKIVALLLALVFCFALVGCSTTVPTDGSTPPADTGAPSDTDAPADDAPDTPPADDTVYSFTYATSNSAESPTYLTIEKVFLDSIREKSGGRIEIVEYVGGSLLGAGAVFNGVVDGSVDMGFDMPANIAGQFPVTSLLEQCCAGPLNATSGAAVSYEFKNTYVPDLAEYDGVNVLWMTDAGPATLTGPTAIRTISDIQGCQIRTNSVNGKAIELLGGTPVIMGMSDVYEAFSTNLLDSGWFVADAMLSFSLQEVANYSTIWPFNHSIIFCVISQDAYNSLPADLQAVIDACAEELYQNVLLGVIDENRNDSLKTAQESNPNLEIIDLGEEDLAQVTETLTPLLAEYAGTLDAQGYDGTGIMNWLTETAAKYNEMYA